MTEQIKESGPVWIIAEQFDCNLLAVSTQLVGQARKLADQLHTTVGAVLLGDNLDKQPHELIAAGADRVYLGNDPQLSFYHPEIYTDIIVALAQEHKPEMTIMAW